MRKLLMTSALGCLCLCAAPSMAHDTQEPPSGIMRASHVLPGEDGDEFRATMHDADEDSRDLKQQIASIHADLYNILTAPDFDRDAFLARTKEIRRLNDKIKENRDQAFASAVEDLPQEERDRLANELERQMHKPTRHHHPKRLGDGSSPPPSQ